MTQYCPTHIPGTPWTVEHGCVLGTSLEYESVYNMDMAWIARLAERHGLPVGVIIPREVFELICRAHRAQDAAKAEMIAQAWAVLNAAAARFEQKEAA